MSYELVKIDQLVRRRGKWISKYPGTYSHWAVVQYLREMIDRKVSPMEIAKMLHPYGKVTECMVRQVRWHGWRAYQQRQDEGTLCYPCYDKDHYHIIIWYKTFLNDEDDEKYWPLYEGRLARNEERGIDRHRIVTALHLKATT
jgi:hypothetical protein